jgi:large subunit ribosomal protein L17
MRHQKKGFKLNRTAAHRKATMAALSNSLIRHKRITTTWTKARALRMYIEPIINRSKVDSTHNRRQVYRHLQDKFTVTELFGSIATHIGERPGGYTRIIKLGQRAGDSAEMAMIELVDYNDVRPDGTGTTTKRKTRRAGKKRSDDAPQTKNAVGTTAAATGVAVEAEVVPEVVEEAAAEVTEAEIVPEVVEKAAAEVAEDAAADVVEDAESDESPADEPNSDDSGEDKK